MPHQPQAAPGQNHIKEDGEQLDEIQVGDRQIGDGGQKIEVGHIVVADGQLDGPKAAVVPEGGHPLGQEDGVVVRYIVQQDRPQEKGQAYGEQRGPEGAGGVACPVDQPKCQQGDGRQQEKDRRLGAGAALGQGGNGKEGTYQQGSTAGTGGQRQGGSRSGGGCCGGQ